MSNIKDQYAELLNLTRQYLLQNYEAKATKATDLESFTFFKRCAQQQRDQNARNPQPSTSLTSSAPTPTISRQIATTVQAPVAAKQELPKTTPLIPRQHPNPTPAPQQHNVAPPQQVIQPEKKSVAPLPFSSSASIPEKVTAPEKKVSETVPGNSKALFQLDPLQPAAMIDLNDIRQIVAERFPAQKILDEIPSDAAAKRKVGVSNITPAEVLILSFSQDPKQQAFLNNVANAIGLLLKLNAQVINAVRWEQEAQWDRELDAGILQLVIANGEHIHTLPKLIQHYREERKESDNSNETKYYVAKTPLCLLSEVSLYFKDPKLKASLWKSICALKHP
jgi:hypothetical protein